MSDVSFPRRHEVGGIVGRWPCPALALCSETMARRTEEGSAHEGDQAHQAIELSGRASPYPVSRLAPRFDLVDVARQIQEADTLIGAVAERQLELIAKQIRGLQDEARAVIERARRDAELHRATCRFVKRPGAVYHLYRRPSGELYLSLLSPGDWNGVPPHAFEGSYRLENDMSFSKLEGGRG